jgi:transcriptional regulator with XRE-family HTH domain
MLEGITRNIVGPQVRRFRENAGLTQEDLAARCSVQGFTISSSTVSHIENGIRGISDLEMVLLSEALRVDIRALIPKKLPTWKKDLRPPMAFPDE